MNSDNIVLLLQASVSPVVLISGVGLLLLSMTNRFGRVVDRARFIAKEIKGVDDRTKKKLKKQLSLLYRRANLLRTAILTSSISILLVALIIMVLFVEAILGIDAGLLIAFLFIVSIGSLIVSMIYFLRDLTLSLDALRMEISDQV